VRRPQVNRIRWLVRTGLRFEHYHEIYVTISHCHKLFLRFLSQIIAKTLINAAPKVYLEWGTDNFPVMFTLCLLTQLILFPFIEILTFLSFLRRGAPALYSVRIRTLTYFVTLHRDGEKRELVPSTRGGNIHAGKRLAPLYQTFIPHHHIYTSAHNRTTTSHGVRLYKPLES
jgi:hypothetical protein